MKTVEQLADDIVAREGGYVNDPADPGGPTNHGVTLATMRRLLMDLDGDGDIDAQDVKQVTRQQARDVFLEHYFVRPHIDLLPQSVQASVFDMYVNAGANAVVILQRLLVDMGQSLSVDGVIGAQTATACKIAMSLAPHHFVDAYGIARRNYYYALADERPQSRKYARTQAGTKGGWIKRAEEFISPRYHLTPAEHAARVSAWG
ncbi:putative Peptidoglycan domain protein [Aquimixticola soesokkakensis]|uniref:Putative Peptidoglycan domain protein n=1 Tax=Aquimixticola soesokkakensis TaxID=1519096 RepID=A0A1Y5TN95_9RHOB|nr:holin-associated N-acetylmuramidase [Aquimixticola soesokkakensis]SLN65867.1 putative Peptidoglycan domain protein [Aquimixticola soesokkakensis]